MEDAGDIQAAAEAFKSDIEKKDCKSCKWAYPEDGAKQGGVQQQPARGGISAQAAAASELLPCPPDYNELGRHTWTYLHSLSLYYPPNPSRELQQDMRTHLETFSRLYPCSPCAIHMQDYLEEHPLQLESRDKFGMWMCNFHNEVNRLKQKPQFDCRRLLDRWTLPPPSKCFLERPPTYDLFVDADPQELNAGLYDDDADDDEDEDPFD